MSKNNVSESVKLIYTLLIILFVLGANHIATRTHPQEILINPDTVLTASGNMVQFNSIDSTGANIIVANQAQDANTDDTVIISSNSYVKLTGNQVNINGDSYYSGIYTIPSKINHVILFQQPPILTKISFENTLTTRDHSIIITPTGNSVFNVQTGDTNYNLVIEDGDSTFITDSENFGFYKIIRVDDEFLIYPVGVYSDNFELSSKVLP